MSGVGKILQHLFKSNTPKYKQFNHCMTWNVIKLCRLLGHNLQICKLSCRKFDFIIFLGNSPLLNFEFCCCCCCYNDKSILLMIFVSYAPLLNYFVYLMCRSKCGNLCNVSLLTFLSIHLINNRIILLMNTQVTYCCSECQKRAWEEYHQTLCMGSSRQDENHPLYKLQEMWRYLFTNIHMHVYSRICLVRTQIQQITDITK